MDASRAGWPLAFALLLALPLAGCFHPLPACTRDGALPAFEPGAHPILRCVDGRERTAVAVIPATLDGDAPLLLMLHGGGGSASQMRRDDNMDAAAAALGFVVVYADGTPGRRGSDLRTWNAMHCCGYAFDHAAPDVEFLGGLLTDLVAAWPLDDQRIGVAGHSNGAMMAYRLAAQRSDVVTLVASVAGAIGGEPSPGDPVRRIAVPSHPVSVLILHAEDDAHVLYAGGQGEGIGTPRVDLSVAQAVAFWTDAIGADAQLQAVARQDGVAAGRTTGELGTQLVLLTTQGGHGWPGSSSTRNVAAPAVPDAALEIGRFLMDTARDPLPS